jgi:hypothetical protein
MMRIVKSVGCGSWLFAAGMICSTGLAQAWTRPTAEMILDDAKAQAALSDRAVLAIFHASWCGWCEHFDRFLDSGKNKPIIDKYFVTAHFRVLEHGGNAIYNTPKADALFTRLGGPSGLPFFAFLTSKGDLIVNSKRLSDNGERGVNIGFPSKPDEIDWFMTMIGKAAPQMTAEEAAILEKSLGGRKRK